jgi:catechol 2,3-dioxygenase-like lactoylglutathione lyase family enzyme
VTEDRETSASGPLGTISVAATTLYAADLDAAIAWYDAMLGLLPFMVGKDGHAYATYQIGGSLVVLEPIEAALEAAPPGAESTTINLLVDRDADESRAELMSRGVPCGEIVDSPGYRSYLFRDLDGNRYYAAQPITRS